MLVIVDRKNKLKKSDWRLLGLVMVRQIIGLREMYYFFITCEITVIFLFANTSGEEFWFFFYTHILMILYSINKMSLI